MNIKIVSFTLNGAKLCNNLEEILNALDYKAVGYSMRKYSDIANVKPIENGLATWTKEAFEEMDAIIFVGASGIAVRSIAPYIKDKTKDPAVIVIDDGGNFVISLLSGHLGGANDLARKIAEEIKATPVITTATDVNNTLAVDSWAQKNNLVLCDMKAAKYIAAELLDKHDVGIISKFAIEGDYPENIISKAFGSIGINIDLNDINKPFETTLNLIPKIITIGVGCRKNTSFDAVEDAVLEALKINNIDVRAVKKICSIDLKAMEKGIIDFSTKYELPFNTFKSEELIKVKGEFTKSKFVSSITGVDNVCERSAVLGSNGGMLLMKKWIKNSVTVAIAMEEVKIKF